MTDLEKFIELYKSIGVDVHEANSQYYNSLDVYVQDRIEYSLWFDSDGKFIEQLIS